MQPLFGKSGGLMVSALDSRSSSQGLSWPGTLYCVFRKDTLLSQCLSSPRCINGYWHISCWGYPCDGLESHPGGRRNTPRRFMLRKRRWAPAWQATLLERRLYQADRYLTDTWPILDQYFNDGRSLHIDRYIGRLATDYWSTIGRLSVDYRPTIGR